MARSIIVSLAGLLVTMAGVTTTQPQAASAPMADKTPTIESRLRDLEYPELQKRSAEEIEVYKQLVLSADLTYKRIHGLYKLGAKGGEAEKNSQAALYAELAMAELAWAERRVEDAYAHTYRALWFAQRYIETTRNAYETGTVTLDCLCDSQIRCAKTKLLLIRAEKVAKVAGVDLTAVKRHESELHEGIKPIPENPAATHPEPPRPTPPPE
jgi:hypothetical protein